MAEITASDVKKLRDRTGAGMMDCKKALVECEGDLENAIDWLRKKGLAAAAKKAGRVAAEGLVGLAVNERCGAILEVNAETDFVARNDLFKSYVSTTVDLALSHKADLEKLGTLPYPNTDRTVSEELISLIANIGENMALRRVSYLSVEQGAVAAYVHNKVSDNLGKIGVLVALESGANADKLRELGKKIAMHIAASNPCSVSIESVDPKLLERESAIVEEQARATGKKEEFIAQIVKGRLRKFYEESVLLEQVYALDGESRVKDVISSAEKEFGAPIKITGFIKFVLGEGIEKQVVDFAAEVAAQLS